MAETEDNWWKTMIVLTLILGIFNLMVTLDLSAKMNPINTTVEHNFSTICDTIPVRFLIEEPVCAVKLLNALNESAFQIDPRNTTSIDNEIERQTQYWVGRYIDRQVQRD